MTSVTAPVTCQLIPDRTQADSYLTGLDEAEDALNRAPQTLRRCVDDPIRPIQINGRLARRVSDLQNFLNGVA